jgi:hypothetical protein
MKVRINKHTDKLCWFTLDFHSFVNSMRVIRFFESRYSVYTRLCPVDKKDEYQVSIEFSSQEDMSAFEFYWLSNNKSIEL